MPKTIDLLAPRQGWIRRLAPPRWKPGLKAGSKEAAVRGAWTSLLSSIIEAEAISWLTPLPRLFFQENKLVQSGVAERLGIRTPKTVVVSDKQFIGPESGEQFIIKPLGVSTYTEEACLEMVVWTTQVSRDSPALDQLGGAPFLVQEQLRPDRHLRIVTVSDQAWVCELPGRDLPVDWRRDETAHNSFTECSESLVAQDALQLSKALNVGYSSQDWIITEDIAYFVDLNPAGQWLFLPERVAESVTSHLASWLLTAGPTSDQV